MEHTVEWTDFNFTIPSRAVIVGVEVNMTMTLGANCKQNNYGNGISVTVSHATLVGFDNPSNLSAHCCGQLDSANLLLGNSSSLFGLPATFVGALESSVVGSADFGVAVTIGECGCTWRPNIPALRRGTVTVSCPSMRLTYKVPPAPASTSRTLPASSSSPYPSRTPTPSSTTAVAETSATALRPSGSPRAPTPTTSAGVPVHSTFGNMARKASPEADGFEVEKLVIIIAVVVCCNLFLTIGLLVACRYIYARRSPRTSSARGSRRRGSNSSGPHRGKQSFRSPSVRRGKPSSTLDDIRLSSHDSVLPDEARSTEMQPRQAQHAYAGATTAFGSHSSQHQADQQVPPAVHAVYVAAPAAPQPLPPHRNADVEDPQLNQRAPATNSGVQAARTPVIVYGALPKA